MRASYPWSEILEHIPPLLDARRATVATGVRGAMLVNLAREFAIKGVTAETIRDLRSALPFISAVNRKMWVDIGHALASLGPPGHQLWFDWMRYSPTYVEGDEEQWETFKPTSIDFRFVFAEAARNGWANPRCKTQRAADVEFQPTPTSGAELLAMEFAPVKWTVRDLLAAGLYLVVAPPKLGKSWFCLQGSIAVGTGGTLLGQPAVRGAVLYLALEDNPRRLKSRLAKLGVAAGDVTNVYFETEWRRIDEGGAEALDTWLAAHADARLVIIDVLERIRPTRNAKANAYGEDYDAIRQIKAIADKHDVTVIVVHHTRKSSADDPLDMISGTQGVAGGADGMLLFRRPRGAERGELHVIGRDLPDEGCFVVEFKRQTCRWELVGRKSEVASTDERQQLLDVLRTSTEPLSPTQIAEACGRKRPSTQHLLAKLVAEGSVIRHPGGKYEIASFIDGADLSVPLTALTHE